MKNQHFPKTGVALTAGGARAAYQVGVLQTLSQQIPEFRVDVFTGMSAGSINAAYLSQGQPLPDSTEQLSKLWANLYFDKVFRTNFGSLFKLLCRISYDLTFHRVSQNKQLTALLDASPLSHTLTAGISHTKIAKSIAEGELHGLAISTTNYNTGDNTVFFDSREPITPWHRSRRKAIHQKIRVKHIMASCSIPIVFEPVKIGGHFYGDGCIRFRFPLSPAIHLGANRLIAIGLSPQKKHTETSTIIEAPESRLSFGLVSGVVLNSIFVNSLDADIEYLNRINSLLKNNPQSDLKPIEVHSIKPSQDLGILARDYLENLPFHLRQIVKASASNKAQVGDLLSYLLFDKDFIQALLELGKKDALSHIDQVKHMMSLETSYPI